MINLYFWPTPNGYKPLILLEEIKLEYGIIPVNILRGNQFEAKFLEISPNNRIPALVDNVPQDGNKSISLFESGSILIYLAEKVDKFLSHQLCKRHQTLQWLMWQMGGVGPMMGQANHFMRYAPETIDYAKERYINEVNRLFQVAERQLVNQDYFVGEYSIADIACYPWMKHAEMLTIELSKYPRVRDWIDRISDRPAVQRAYTVGEPVGKNEQIDDEARRLLFGISKPSDSEVA